MNDSYGNYLALAFDKIYYLNDGSVQKLNDLSLMGKTILLYVWKFIFAKYVLYAHIAALVVPRLDLKR
jgi:hypothetical protein